MGPARHIHGAVVIELGSVSSPNPPPALAGRSVSFPDSGPPMTTFALDGIISYLPVGVIILMEIGRAHV